MPEIGSLLREFSECGSRRAFPSVGHEIQYSNWQVGDNGFGRKQEFVAPDDGFVSVEPSSGVTNCNLQCECIFNCATGSAGVILDYVGFTIPVPKGGNVWLFVDSQENVLPRVFFVPAKCSV